MKVFEQLKKKKELGEVGYNLLPLTSAVNQLGVGKHSLPGQSEVKVRGDKVIIKKTSVLQLPSVGC